MLWVNSGVITSVVDGGFFSLQHQGDGKSTADWVFIEAGVAVSSRDKHTGTIRNTDRQRETPTHCSSTATTINSSASWSSLKMLHRIHTTASPPDNLLQSRSPTPPPGPTYLQFYKSRDEILKRVILQWYFVAVQLSIMGSNRDVPNSSEKQKGHEKWCEMFKYIKICNMLHETVGWCV